MDKSRRREEDRRKTSAAERTRKVRESELFLNEVGRMAKVGGWKLNVATGKVHWTAETYRIHDIPEDMNYVLSGAVSFFDLPGRAILEAAIKRCIETGESYDLQLAFTSAKGRHLWTHTIGHAVRKDGKTIELVGTFQDITDRKQAQEALKEQAQLLDISPLSITVHDENGVFLYANDRTFAMHGYTKEEFLSLNLRQIDESESANLISERMKRIAEKGEARFEVRHARKNGSSFPLEVYAKKADWFGKPVLLSIAEDITERKRAEKAQRESEERFRLVQEMSPDGFTILHPLRNENGEIFDFTWVFENQTIARINGTDPQEMIGKRLLDFFPTHKGTSIFETYIHVADTGNPRIIEEVYVGKIVSEEKWLRLVVIPMGDDIGILAQDITERKQVRERIEAALREKEVMLKEIHHRVKNNLQVVSSLLNLHSPEIRDPLALRFLQESRNRVRSMALIHDRLYRSTDFSRINLTEYTTALVTQLLVTYQIPGNRIERNIDIRDVYLNLDRAIPAGLLLNELISNALKYAFPDKRPGRISVGMVRSGTGECILTVSDNGVGLPPDLDVTKPSNLGLQIVQSLVGQLDGTMEVVRRGGTTFRIRFPLRDRDA